MKRKLLSTSYREEGLVLLNDRIVSVFVFSVVASPPLPRLHGRGLRIAEVEAFLNTTTKLMQIQVEVVDRKIDNEIAGLKTELSKLTTKKEIEKHAEDGFGKVDYAVASGGEIVLKHSEPFIRPNKLSRWISRNVHSDVATKWG
ncbi:hypothetical protein L2E82_21821 [Cichorium intybus]|uniref:Uncharacterized protein n=1 Tax=Cichorium intybus TaxID=13427 RepID=A0ACB9DW36_CICIN|nr:hypothetical protein L2E82_21821 [Cichorium intybus]